jgi:hypothetical protein
MNTDNAEIRLLLQDIKFKAEEQVWLLIDGKLIEQRNIAADKVANWQLPDGLELPVGCTIVHTHVHSKSVDGFSLEDWQGIEQLPKELKLKHYVYHVPTGAEAYYDSEWLSSSCRPYTKRNWSWSVDNCHSLCREWLNRETELLVKPFHIAADGLWSEVDFALELHKADFIRVAEPQWSDVVLMAGGHIGIYLDVNKVLHHASDRASAVTGIHGQVSYWRYKTTVNAEPVTLLTPDNRLLVTNTIQMPLTMKQLDRLKSGKWSQSKGYRLVLS